MREISQLIGKLCYSAIAVVPARLNYRPLQRQQIFEFFSRQELKNFRAFATESEVGAAMVDSQSQTKQRQVTIDSKPSIVDSVKCFNERLGGLQSGTLNEGPWSNLVTREHINVLELKAAKLAIMTFTKMLPDVKVVHLRMNNMVALSYIKKMGGGEGGITQNTVLSELAKEIWDYLIVNGITFTVEYLPGILSVEADFQSRSVTNSSKWKLNPERFRMICKALGAPDIDLFALRMSHQLPMYISWEPDPFSRGVDAFQQSWRNLRGYVFPPFCHIGKVLEKVQIDMATIILINPAWKSQTWYPKAPEQMTF